MQQTDDGTGFTEEILRGLRAVANLAEAYERHDDDHTILARELPWAAGYFASCIYLRVGDLRAVARAVELIEKMQSPESQEHICDGGNCGMTPCAEKPVHRETGRARPIRATKCGGDLPKWKLDLVEAREEARNRATNTSSEGGKQ